MSESRADNEKKLDQKQEQETTQVTVYVGSLAFDCSEENLREHFGKCGDINAVNLPLNETGKPKGIAFIRFASEKSAAKALKLHASVLLGKKLKVNLAGTKSEGRENNQGKKQKQKQEQQAEEKRQKGVIRKDELTVFVSGFSRDDMESFVRKKFETCGVVD